MDFLDKIQELSARMPKQLDAIQTEEATKHALIMPFISALGYNVFDPTEVTPELCADVGIKKGEKVDYAILKDGKPVILFECKHHATDLGKVHASQLYRYFSATSAKFGVLTNGVHYWFYTDLEAPNKMDTKPFFKFNMLEVDAVAGEELKKFSKSSFDLDFILSTAAELKHTREIKAFLSEQMQEPSEDFVRLVVARVSGARMTQPVREQFTQLTKQAFKQFLNDKINERLKSALATESPADGAGSPITDSEPAQAAGNEEAAPPAIQTTDEEMDGYHIVRAILRTVVNPKRIVMRDVQSYCGILLDDNNRKPICRLHFNTAQKYVSFFDGDGEERVPIEDVDDIYKYAARLKAAVERHEPQAVAAKVEA